MAVATNLGHFRAILARSQAQNEIPTLIAKTAERLIDMKAALSLPMRARQFRMLPSHVSYWSTPNTPKHPHNEPVTSIGGKPFDVDWIN